ncbi:MAG: Asp-tRNA(Asn)/Glu-tRNA(Gln) amidotransferase subunit GatB [Oscillospiraceae bacterium]|nr:Asp-tRNA(Asn)/Glu-tRNA(Gln) amidotransferase subunit GatB [Oscillospiraceae bacterium]
MKYEIVIGLETHVELATESKIFCSCGGHSNQEGPNTCVCPACCGMPGMLPVMNKRAVELAVMAGTMLNCQINKYTTFDKKSYYYPDLPCAYQITQWFHPICTNGCVEVKTASGSRKIGIKQIHMEEDAGKLVHDDWTDTSLVDFNRTSVPLIEIVSRPDFRSKEEVVAYLEMLKSTFRFAGISECEEGAMRCDVNISVRPEGSTELGVRTEIKNMSSLVSISRAIEYETARHIDAIERNTEVLVQETRRWDDIKGRTFSMRNKETAADYRYFPDPNLMPIVIDDEWFESIKAKMPMMAEEKAKIYVEQGISEEDARDLTSERKLCELLDKVAELGTSPKTVAAWILTDCAGILRKNGKVIGELSIKPQKLFDIISMVEKGTITRGAGKKVLAAVIEKDVEPEQYCRENALDAQTDSGLIASIVKKVIEQNQNAVKDYLGGKTKAFQALFGACMKELKGNGDPAVIRAELEKELAGKQ